MTVQPDDRMTRDEKDDTEYDRRMAVWRGEWRLRSNRRTCGMFDCNPVTMRLRATRVPMLCDEDIKSSDCGFRARRLPGSFADTKCTLANDRD